MIALLLVAHFHFGYIEWHALGMDWRLFYLPLAAPLDGAGPAGAGHFPNPFKLTGTYASTMPPMFEKDRPRDVEREFRRIQKLKAKPE